MNLHLPKKTLSQGIHNMQKLQTQSPFGLFREALKYVVVIVLSVTYVLPFFWMVTSALKNDSQVYVVPPIWFPKPAFWENFINAWNSQPFNQYLFNTVFRYALPVTVGLVLSSSIVAYGFGRLKWRGRDTLFYLCLATMMVPFQVQMVPLFIIFKHLGWIDSLERLSGAYDVCSRQDETGIGAGRRKHAPGDDVQRHSQ